MGVERRDGGYWIAKDRLWENEERYPWVQHVGIKIGVDVEDFAEALRIARCVHAAGHNGATN